MATTHIKVNVVDVGQGQCTFVEIYGAKGKLTNTLLFDCGSDHNSSKIGENLQYIADTLHSMKVPTINCLVFSHSDSDHISLMASLLGLFSPNQPTIDEVWYGGNYDQYEKDEENILDTMVDEGVCDEDNVNGLRANYTGIDPNSGLEREVLWQSADNEVTLFALVANVLTAKPDFTKMIEDVPERKTPEARNRVSVICGLSFAKTIYVICGDATNATMAAVNSLFEKGTVLFANNVMTTLPHHGSRTTGLKVSGNKKASDKAIDVVTTFSSLMNSKTLTVSAFQKNDHPSLEMMSLFPPENTTPILKDPNLSVANTHLLVAYDTLAAGYYNVGTSSNIFATNYYKAKFNFVSYDFNAPAPLTALTITGKVAIDPHASWVYTTDASGTTTLEGKVNLRAATFTAPFKSKEVLQLAKESPPLPLPRVRPPVMAQRQFTHQLKTFR